MTARRGCRGVAEEQHSRLIPLSHEMHCVMTANPDGGIRINTQDAFNIADPSNTQTACNRALFNCVESNQS